MKCDCIEKLEKNLKEKLNETAMLNVAYFTDGTIRPALTVLYHKEKKGGGYRDKWEEIDILPSYCPFCGKKIEEEGGEK